MELDTQEMVWTRNEGAVKESSMVSKAIPIWKVGFILLQSGLADMQKKN